MTRLFVLIFLICASTSGSGAARRAVEGKVLERFIERVKVYRVTVNPKQATGIRSRTLPWLRVSVSQGTILVKGPGGNPETLETKPGDFRWHEGATTQSIENVGSTVYEAIEIEWK